MATQAELAVLISAKNQASAVLKQIAHDTGTLAPAAKSSTSAFSALGKAATTALAVVGGLTIFSKVSSAISDAASAAIGFEKSMSNIKAVSGATGQQMQQMSALALQLGKDTSFSASQAASGIEELLKGGMSIGDVFGGGAAAALNLAAAGGVSVGEAATIASNALNQFNLKGADMAHVADLVAGAANASSISVSDFNFSLAAVGAVAAMAGQSFDSTAIAIAALGASGIKGSDAGTSLKAVLANLIPTTDVATNKMRELGIITASGANQFIDASGKIKDFGAISEILQTQTAGLTDAQRLLAMELIFGSDGMRAAGILAKGGGEAFAAMGAQMVAAGGAAAIAKEKLNNLSGDIETFKGSVETAGIIVASEFLPALRGIAQGATAAVNTFIQEASTLIQTAKNIAGAQGIGLIPAALTAVELRIGEVFGEKAQGIVHAFRQTAETIVSVIGDVAMAMEPVVHQFASWTVDSLPVALRIVRDLVTPLGDMAKNLRASATAMDVLTAATVALVGASALGGLVGLLTKVGVSLAALNPIFLLIAGTIFPFILMWNTNFEGFRDTTLKAVAAVGSGFAKLGSDFDGIKNILMGGAGAIAAAIVEKFAAIGQAIIDVSATVLPQAQGIAVGIIAALVLGLGSGVGMVIGALVQLVSGAIAAAGPAATAEAATIGSNIVQGIINGLNFGRGGVVGAAINIATAAITAAQSKLKEGSPSKVFEEIGENVDLGFIAGIDGMTADVETAIGDLMTGAGEAATTAAVDAFAGLATALGAQFEKTFTIVEAAQNAIDNARSDLDRKFQRDSELEETKFQRRLQDLREEAGRASVKQRADVLQKIAQLQEDHGRKIVDMQEATLDRISELEFDAADKIAQAQEKQALARGAALRDFQRDTDELLRDTADKAAAIGRKAADAISDAMRDAGQSIIEARDKADEAIQSLQANQAASRDLRGVRDTFAAGQDAESEKRSRDQEDADLEYNLTRDLEKAKLKLGKDRGKAETDQDRRQLDIQYADEVQNLRDGFAEAKRDLARRRAIADDNDAFRKMQQKALQAFNDNLEDDALKKQIVRIQDERDSRIKEIGAALDDKLIKIKQSEADEREVLAKSAAEKLDDLKTKFYDKVGQLNDESKGAFQSLFESIAAGVKAAAGAVTDLSAAINKVATTKAVGTPASGGGGIAAGDGQTFGGQTPDVQQMFLSAYGSRAAAEEAWVAEHNYELDLGNLGKAPKVVNGVDMGPYNGEAGQSWYSTPEESGSNAGDHMASGGVVSGARGAARLITAHGGEGVFTPEQMAALGGMGGGAVELVLMLDRREVARTLLPELLNGIDTRVSLRVG